MTGLFHRLARQVVGPPPPRAHPAIRLPFAAAPAPEPWQTPPLAVPAVVRSAEQETSRRAEAEAVPPLPPLAEPRRETRVPEAPVATHRGRSGPAGEATPGRADSIGSGTATSEPPARRTPESSRSGRQRSAAAPTTPYRAQTREAPAPLPAASFGPSPLLPEVVASTSEPQAWLPNRPAREGPQRVDGGPPEVHVHIGRIDVTSVADPQPPPPRPRRNTPTMSLEDYLAKRRTEG